MIVHRRLKGFLFLFLPVLLSGCSQPFIDIAINLETHSRISPIPVNQFVRQAFIHGPPLDQMKAYANDPKNVKRLLKMLDEPDCKKGAAEGPVCSNVLTTLGVIGGKETIDPLLTFLVGDKTKDFRNKTDAVKAIGLWINSNSVGLRKDKDDVDTGSVFEGLLMFVREHKIATAAPQKRSSTITRYGYSKEREEEKLTQILRSIKIKNAAQAKDLKRAAITGLVFAGGAPEIGIFDNDLHGVLPALEANFSYYILPLIGRSNKDDKIHETLNKVLQSKALAEPSFRFFVSERLRAHDRIRQVGLNCYYEEGRQEMSKKCKKRLAEN